MDKLSIALRLLHFLSSRNEITSDNVKDEFHVTKRTAQRYLAELASFHFVEHIPERHSYKLKQSDKFDNGLLKSAEQAFLKSLIIHAKRILKRDNRDMVRKIEKKLSYVNSHIMIGGTSVDYDRIAEIHIRLERAIADTEKIEFTYTKFNKQYTVDPYSIIFHDGYWYLAAGHNDALKKFSMDYIEDIKSAGTYLFIPDKFAELLKNPQSVWFEQGNTDKVIIKTNPLASDYIKRRPLTSDQIIEAELTDGSLIVRLDTANTMEFFHIICRWIDCIEVIEPLEYKEFIYGIGEKVALCHRERILTE